MKDKLSIAGLWISLCAFLVLGGYFYFYPKAFHIEYAVAVTPTPTPVPPFTGGEFTTKNGKRAAFNIVDTTDNGDTCLDTQGLTNKSIIVTLNSGTATWDVTFSNDNNVTYAILWPDEDTSNSYEFSTEAQSVCVSVTACTNCDVDVSLRAGNGKFTQ